MTVLYTVNTDDVVQAADVNQFKKMLEGTSGYTSTYALTSSTGTNFTVKLGDAAGSNKLTIQNSSGVEVAYIDSNGAFHGTISLGAGTLTFPTSASPSQTTEGQVIWDTDDDILTVGSGAATKIMIPTPTTTAGDMEYASGARAHSRLAIGTAGQVLIVNDAATAPTWSTPGPRAKFMLPTPRRKYAEFTGAALGNYGADGDGSVPTYGVSMGQGFYFTGSVVPVIATDGGLTFATGAGGFGTSSYLGIGGAVSANIATIAPDKNPSMLVAITPPVAAANLNLFQAGFFINPLDGTSSIAGAYLRRVGSGNLFFVTKGGSEQTTDLGASPTTVNFVIETTDSGVTWKCIDADSGSTLATHSTQVPTAATDLGYGSYVRAGNAASYNFVLRYAYIEGDI